MLMQPGVVDSVQLASTVVVWVVAIAFGILTLVTIAALLGFVNLSPRVKAILTVKLVVEIIGMAVALFALATPPQLPIYQGYVEIEHPDAKWRKAYGFSGVSHYVKFPIKYRVSPKVWPTILNSTILPNDSKVYSDVKWITPEGFDLETSWPENVDPKGSGYILYLVEPNY